MLETFEKSRRDTDRERAEATLPAKRNAVQFQSLVELTNESKSPRDPVSRFRRYITLEGGTRRNRGIPRVAGLSFEEFPCGRPCGAIENTGGEPMPFEDPFPRSFPAKGSLRGINRETKACRRNGRLSSLSNCKRSRDEIAGGWLFHRGVFRSTIVSMG